MYLPSMEGSECLCVESLCFHECTDEALGSKGSEGGAGGKAIAGTPPHQSPGTQGLQRGDRAMAYGLVKPCSLSMAAVRALTSSSFLCLASFLYVTRNELVVV